MSDLILTVGGTRHLGWTSATISRGIDRAAASFSIGLTDRWQGQQDRPGATAEPWGILAGSEVTVAVAPSSGGATQAETLITGYVDTIEASLGEQSRTLMLTGRSKTGDLVDCSADVEGGRFRDQTLEQMARLLAEPFGIDVTVEADIGAAFPAVQIETGETVHALLTRLARHRAILVTDTPEGGLRLTQPGASRAPEALAQGVNVVQAKSTITWAQRYSSVTVRGQKAGGGEADIGAEAVHEDQAIDRHRPLIVRADEQVDDADCAMRAKTEIRRRAGAGTQATLTVPRWHTTAGTLWRAGDLISVKAPALGLARDLVIGGVTFRMAAEQRLADLQVAPIEAFAPKDAGGDGLSDGGPVSDGTATASGGENTDPWAAIRESAIRIGREPIE